jgi:nitronate monooxygenase
MALPNQLAHMLAAPAVTLADSREAGPDEVVALCVAGLLGYFDTRRADSLATLQRWLMSITEQLATARKALPHRKIAPFAVRKGGATDSRMDRAVLAVCIAWRVPVIVTSATLPAATVAAIQAYGGLVFKEIAAGAGAPQVPENSVDGLILRQPLAGIRQLRQRYRGTIIWGGTVSCGEELLAAEAMGADLACVGKRFGAAGADCAANELIDEYMTAKLRITQQHRL